MQYKGNLYGSIGGKYIDLEVTADDYDNLKSQLEIEQQQNETLIYECESLKHENEKLKRDVVSLTDERYRKMTAKEEYNKLGELMRQLRITPKKFGGPEMAQLIEQCLEK